MDPLGPVPARSYLQSLVRGLRDSFRVNWVPYGFALTATYCAYQLQQILGLIAVLQIRVLQTHAQVELRGFVLFLIAVILSAAVGGVGPALVSALLAASLINRVVVPPLRFGYMPNPGDRWRWAALVASGVLCGILVEVRHRGARQRLASHRLRDVTLANIGDAVITTDEFGYPTFLNHAAELLTGWNNEQAVGRRFGDILQLINEETRESQGDPLEKVFKLGAATGSSEHTLLLAKDGREIPIAQSTAPIMRPDGTLEGFVFVFRDVSETRNAEAELAKRLELQKQVAHIVDSAPTVIYSFRRRPDGTTCFPFASPEIEGMLGSSRETLARDGALAFSRVHPDDVSHLLAAIDKSSRDLSVWHCEFRVTSEVQGEIWVEGRAIPEREPDGGTLWYGFVNDITEHKRADQRLQLLYKALESAANAVVLTNSLGTIIWVNAAFASMTGYSAGEAIGRNPRILSSGTHPQSFYKQMWETLQAGNVWCGEVINKRKDGTLYTELMTITPVSEDPYGVTHFIAIKQDITQRRIAEEAIRLNEERLRLAQHAAELGVFEVEFPSGKRTWSPEMFRILGFPGDSPPSGSQELLRLCHPDDRSLLEGQFARLAAGERLHVECRIVPPNSELRWVEVFAKAIGDVAGRPVRYLGVVRDVTKRHLLEAQFRQAQKMEAVGRLAGGVAHDFNNILMVITGYGDLLKEQIGSDEQLARMIDEILKAADRAALLTHQLLAFSRKQVLMPKILDLNNVLADIGKMLPRLIGEDIDLRLVLADGVGRVLADASQVQQVVMNLVVNARDAMPDGGKLTIETANAEWKQMPEQMYGLETRPGSFVMLSVTDDGVGMDRETQAHLFEPFFTTKDIDKGTGLGLSIVYGIVKQSGGFILVDSKPGQGTTFKVHLPRVPEEEAIVPAIMNSPKGRTCTETILLVEDADGVRELMADFLRAQGYSVLEASNPRLAIEIAQRQDGPIQLLLTDITMPEMSGMALAKELSASRPLMKMLYISGYTDREIMGDASTDPVVNFLQKPFALDVLGRKVRDILEG